MRINGAGNLGLGVTPSAWGSSYKALDVRTASVYDTPTGNSSGFTFNAYFNGTNWIYKGTGGNATALRYEQGFGQHQWFTAPSGTAGNAISFTQAMTLDASGNLLVGTTSNSYSDRAVFNGGVGIYGVQLNTAPGASTNFEFVNRTGAGFTYYVNNATLQAMTLDASGNLGIGTSSPSQKLDVAGSILASGNVTAYSDIRVKDNVESIEGAIGKLNQIRGVTYTRTDLDDKQRRFAGVIAQEIEQVLPEAVFDNGRVKAVDYNATIALLIEAVKEQQGQINELKLTIEQLKGN
jgi:hypothetical protein